LRRDWARRSGEFHVVSSAVRKAVRDACDIAIKDVVLVKPGALPRTSSGKIRRRQCRCDYLSKELRIASTVMVASVNPLKMQDA
jgi:acyl-CoA synthetase (AMP-forming)/AMP-acid ligase II